MNIISRTITITIFCMLYIIKREFRASKKKLPASDSGFFLTQDAK